MGGLFGGQKGDVRDLREALRPRGKVALIVITALWILVLIAVIGLFDPQGCRRYQLKSAW